MPAYSCEPCRLLATSTGDDNAVRAGTELLQVTPEGSLSADVMTVEEAAKKWTAVAQDKTVPKAVPNTKACLACVAVDKTSSATAG